MASKVCICISIYAIGACISACMLWVVAKSEVIAAHSCQDLDLQQYVRFGVSVVALVLAVVVLYYTIWIVARVVAAEIKGLGITDKNEVPQFYSVAISIVPQPLSAQKLWDKALGKD